MATHELKTRLDCEDFVRGCTVMGTGGGGSRDRGVETLWRGLDEGLKLSFTDIDDLADDVWIACPFLMGSIAPKTAEDLVEMQDLGLTAKKYPNAIMNAIQELGEYTGKKIGGVIPIELGGGNTAESVVQAARLGITCVDGDYTGRAIPEITQITPELFDKTLDPLTGVDEWGNITIVKSVINSKLAERIGKYLAVAAHGLVCMAGMLYSAKECKQIVVRNTLSACLHLGRAIREAQVAGKDAPAVAAEKMGGWIVFKGEVTKKEWEDRAGYYWGTHTLTGIEEFAGQTFKVWFKNENHMSWLNGEPFVMSPDLVCLVARDSGEPKTNDAVAEGDVMSVIGARAPQVFLNRPKGLEVLGPTHFGFDYPFVPIEKLIKA